MEKKEQQQLFLIEFLVDRVNVPAVKAMHNEIMPATTCVSFQILSLPLITIHQDEPSTSDCTCLEESELFRKGKSCLFALPTIVLEKPLHSFPITMSVYKKLPPGVLPDVMLIGSCQIEIKDLVNYLLQNHVFKSGNPCKSRRDTFKITTATGQQVGDATIFIRASCFGSKIVTQFQIPQNKKPYLFKGQSESPVFQCQKVPSDMDSRIKSLNTPKCTCGHEKYENKKNSETNNKKNGKTCCSSGSPPPPPPPTTPINKEFDLSQFSGPRACCPSTRGQNCPENNYQQQNNPVNATRNQLERGKNCGCSN